MIVSNKFGYLYVHIPKTGGSSMRSVLNRLRWRDPLYYMQFICSRFSHWSGHKTGTKFPRHARIIAAKEMLPKPYFDSLFKFAIVRNPWDVQVSAYHHIKRDHPHLLGKYQSFEDYLKYRFDPARSWDYFIDGLSQPQMSYLVDLDGSVLVDFMGRFERLEEDVRNIFKTLGLDLNLPHHRKEKSRKDYRKYYNLETIELVQTHYQRDIEFLSYSFE